MADSKLPEGWGSQKSNVKPWIKTQNDRPAKPSFHPEKEDQPPKEDKSPTVDSTKEEIKHVNPDNGKTAPDTSSEDDTPKENLPTEKKKSEPKTIRRSTVVLSIALTAAICFLIAFAFLYFSGKSGNQTNSVAEPSVTETADPATEEATESAAETAITESAEAKPTAKPDPTAEPATANTDTHNDNDDSGSYIIDVINYVHYYEQPDYTSKITGTFTELTKYTIVDEAYDKDDRLWGKLKSGVGWVNIEDATDTHYTNRVSSARRAYLNSPYKKCINVEDIVFCYDPVWPVDEMSSVDEGYFDKINSVTVDRLSSTSFDLHIVGEFQTNDGVAERLCCWEMDSDFHTLNKHDLSEPILNEDFDIHTAIGICENTEVIYIAFDYTSRLM